MATTRNLLSSLSVRVALAFALLAILLATVLGLAIRDNADAVIEEQVRLMLTQVAASTRDRLDRKMADFSRDVRHRAEVELIENPSRDPAHRRRSIELLRKAWPEFSWIAFVRNDGLVEQSVDRLLEGQNVSSRPWFQRALTGENVTDVHEAKLLQSLLGREGQEPLRFVDIAYPVRTADGKLAGIFGVHVSWDFAKALARSALQLHYRVRGLELLIYDNAGQVLLGPAGEPRLSDSILAQARNSNEVVVLDESASSSRHVMALSATRGEGDYRGLGWIVAVRQDAERAYAPARKLDRDIVNWAVLVVALFVVMAGIAAERLAQPLVRLTETADQLRLGQKNVEFPDTGSGLEVGRLSAALRSMVAVLSKNEETLKEANQSLEARVRERTQDLERTTAELERERERLTLSLDGSRIAAWDADTEKGEVWLSSEWSVMLGGPREETRCTYAELLALVPADDRERVSRVLMGVLQGQLPFYDVEHLVLRKDGSRFWIRSRGTVTSRNAQGLALRMAGTNSDTTRRKMAEDDLRQSEQKLRLVADNLPFMITFNDRQCRFLFVNRPYLEFLGFENQDILGKSLRDVAGEEAYAHVLSGIPRLEAGEFVSYERVRADRLGRLRHLDVVQIPHFQEDGTLAGFFSLIEDTTEKRESERAIKESEKQLRLVLDNLPTSVCELNLDGQILFANRRYCEQFGLSETEVRGKRVDEMGGKEALEQFLAHVPQLLTGQSVVYERTIELKGAVVHREIHLVPEYGPEGIVNRTYALIHDITERKQVERLLTQQAMTDSLTGLPNQRLLMDRLTHALAQARRDIAGVALLYLDLDGFKPVNDQYGHAAGDELLRQVAGRLSGSVREGDTVARLGGDEFVVLLEPCTSEDDANRVATKIITSLQEPFEVKGVAVHISASVGIGLSPADATSASALLAHADRGLYAAKEEGKGRYKRLVS